MSVQATGGIGFPLEKPRYSPFKHGWFLQMHINLFSQIITRKVKVIVEIGSWYGSSTKWLAETAEEAKIYAIDLWDDNFILQDDHYTASKHSFLRDHPLYPTFLVNLWDHRDRVVPLRMDSVAGLEYLSAQGVKPDIIYIDADHHYAAAKRDIQACMRLFPDAILVGDDYGNYEDVRRAVHECAVDKLMTGMCVFLSFPSRLSFHLLIVPSYKFLQFFHSSCRQQSLLDVLCIGFKYGPKHRAPTYWRKCQAQIR